MKSTVKFTTNYSRTHVTSLDTKVKFDNRKLVTKLYAKPLKPFQFTSLDTKVKFNNRKLITNIYMPSHWHLFSIYTEHLTTCHILSERSQVSIHMNSSNLHHTRILLGSCYKLHIFFQISKL